MEKCRYTSHIPETYFIAVNKVYPDGAQPFSKSGMEELCRIRAKQDEIVFLFNKDACLTAIYPGEETMYFGYWEGTNTAQSHQDLFDELDHMAKARGCTKLIGPVNFNTYHGNRICIEEGKAWQRFPGEPSNPMYYRDILEANGFEIDQAYASHYIGPDIVSRVYARQQVYIDSLAKIPFVALPVNEEFWNRNLPSISKLLHEIFSQNHRYQSVGMEEFELEYGAEFAAKICPHTSVIFQHIESGEWAAISLCMPNYHENPDLQAPFQFDRDYRSLPRKTFLAKTVGVHPNYRNQHLMRYLAAYGMIRFPEYYEDAIFCLMREDSISNSFTARLPREEAHYALFSKGIS